MSERRAAQTLGAAAESSSAYASCARCGRYRKLDLDALAAKYGRDFPLFRLKRRLVCATCGKRDRVGVTLQWKRKAAAALSRED